MMFKKRLASAKKDALVALVKLVQQRRLKGSKGGWKEFLNLPDGKSGDKSLSNPRKSSGQFLVSFLKTFTESAHIKLLEKALREHCNRKAISKLNKTTRDLKSSKLVRLTSEHPEYESSYSFSSLYDEDWVITSMGNKSRSNVMLAVACQMVECEDGTEAVVKVCVVDENLEVKLDKLVNPNKPVKDYNTKITGITAKDLKGVAYSLADVQESMNKLLSNGTVLIGHRLHYDLEVLRLNHARVIDTSLIFKRVNGESKRPTLRSLCKDELGHKLRKKGAQHDCLENARAVMKLVLGFDDQVIKELGDDLSKQLMLHRIPKRIRRGEIRALFSEDSTVVLNWNDKKKGKEFYSVNAVFKEQAEAHEAFKSIKGEKGKDTNGFPQKRVSVQLKDGNSDFIYVRKMHKGPLALDSSSRKRQIEEVEPSTEESNPKRQMKNTESSNAKATPTEG